MKTHGRTRNYTFASVQSLNGYCHWRLPCYIEDWLDISFKATGHMKALLLEPAQTSLPLTPRPPCPCTTSYRRQQVLHHGVPTPTAYQPSPPASNGSTTPRRYTGQQYARRGVGPTGSRNAQRPLQGHSHRGLYQLRPASGNRPQATQNQPPGTQALLNKELPPLKDGPHGKQPQRYHKSSYGNQQ